MKHTILIFALLALAACGSENKEIRQIELDRLSEIDPELTSDLQKIGSIDAIIPLGINDTVVVGEIRKLQETDDYFFVSALQQPLLLFDREGRVVRAVGHIGRGPQEYLGLRDFYADPRTGTIYIMDVFGRKMITYGFDGVYRTKWDLPENYSLNSFFLAGNEIVYTSTANAVNPELYSYNLDTRETVVVSTPEREMGVEGFVGNTFVFGRPEEPRLYHYFNDTVFVYQNRTLTPDYILSTGSATLTFDEAAGQRPTGSRIQISGITEAGDYTFVHYAVTRFRGDGRKNFTAFFSDDSGMFYPNVTFVDSESGLKLSWPVFQGYDRRSLLSVAYPYELEETTLAPELPDDGIPILIRYRLK